MLGRNLISTSVAILLAAAAIVCFIDHSQAATPSILPIRSSFASWDKWLHKFIEEEDPEENLAAALFKLGRLKKSEQADLGHAIGSLKLVSEAQDCDETVVKALEKIAAGSNPALGQRRVDKLANFYVSKIYKQCEKFWLKRLDSLIGEPFDESKQVDRFFEVMIPAQLKQVADQPQMSEDEKNKLLRSLAEADSLVAEDSELSDKELAQNLRLLSKGDPRCVYKQTSNGESDPDVVKQAIDPIYMGNFKYAFNRYLVEPCKYYDKIFGEYFDSAYALKSLNPELAGLVAGGETRVGPALATNPLHLNDLPNEWFVHLFQSKMCTRTLNISMARLRQIFREIQSM